MGFIGVHFVDRPAEVVRGSLGELSVEVACRLVDLLVRRHAPVDAVGW